MAPISALILMTNAPLPRTRRRRRDRHLRGGQEESASAAQGGLAAIVGTAEQTVNKCTCRRDPADRPARGPLGTRRGSARPGGEPVPDALVPGPLGGRLVGRWGRLVGRWGRLVGRWVARQQPGLLPRLDELEF